MSTIHAYGLRNTKCQESRTLEEEHQSVFDIQNAKYAH